MVRAQVPWEASMGTTDIPLLMVYPVRLQVHLQKVGLGNGCRLTLILGADQHGSGHTISENEGLGNIP